MGTSFVNPTANPNPMLDQDQFIDPTTGNLTYSAWWLIHSLRNGTQVSLNGTIATVVPAANGGDNSVNINAAIMAVIAIGGGALQLVAGDYLVLGSVVFPRGFNGILFLGNGATIVRAANMPVNQGVFDIQGAERVTVQNLTIEGGVTVSAKVNYSTFHGDPMFAAFTLNTSVWVHAGSTDILLEGVTIQHTGGYAFLSDTRIGPNNQRLKLNRCNFWNNRPFTFGTNNADLNYGSWPGGVFYKGDCSTALEVGVTEDFSVTDCSFERNTGNCVWGHNSGFFNYHRNIRVMNNGFLDCGLDAIEIACTVGGCVIGNVGQRIGYITTDDTSRSTPKYLPGLNATYLDTSGYVEGVPIIGNSCTSMCGGFSAPDGYCYAAITGNDFRQPQPGDVLYADDQIGLIPAGVVYGFALGNSSANNGGDGVDLSGNSLYGCSAGSILATAFRNGKIAANNIWQPGTSTFSPILLGNLGAGALQRSYGNSITDNRIYWSPVVPKPAIIESTDWSGTPIPWAPGDANWVEGNHIFDQGANAFEFSRAPSTSSITSRRLSSSTPDLTAGGYIDLNRITLADGTGGYTSLLNSVGTEPYRLYDADHAASLATSAVWAQRDVRFRHTAGDHAQAGSIQYRGATAAGALAIFGAGTTTANRLLNLYDLVTINGAAGAVALTVTAGDVQFGADFAWDDTGSILTIGGGVGSGVVAYLFNSTATGTDNAIQQSAGTFTVTGAGDAFFQNVTVHSVFNSQADVHGGNAFQTSGGTMHVTGTGNGSFQNLTATTDVSSGVSMSIAGQPVATQAYADAGDASTLASANATTAGVAAAKADHGTYPVVAGSVTI